MIADEARSRALDLGYAAGWKLVCGAPLGLTASVFRTAADVATRRDGPGVRQLRKNLRRVLGPEASAEELEDLLRRSMRSYSRYWLETFRLPRMDHRDVAARAGANTANVHYIDEAVRAGRGFILALPHIGNWDVAGLWLIDRYGMPFTTVAERLEPASLFDRFVDYRSSLGFEVLPLTGGERPASEVLAERLRAGRGICLLADRALSGRGIEVEFFGETATMPPGPAMLAATTGAALLPVSMWFTEDGWAQRANAPIELGTGRLRERVAAATQQLADAFATDIAAHPADWHMLQRLWVGDR